MKIKHLAPALLMAAGSLLTMAPRVSAVDVNIPAPNDDVRITKTDNVESVVPGQDVTYQVVIHKNSSDPNVVGVTLRDAIPASLTNVTWDCLRTMDVGLPTQTTQAPAGLPQSEDNGCPGPGTGADFASNAGVSFAVLADATYTFTFHATVSPSATGSVVNTASITALNYVDTNPSNDVATDTDLIIVPTSSTAAPSTTLPETTTVAPVRADIPVLVGPDTTTTTSTTPTTTTTTAPATTTTAALAPTTTAATTPPTTAAPAPTAAAPATSAEPPTIATAVPASTHHRSGNVKGIDLSLTGAETLPTTLAGVSMLGVGVALLVVGRRRRSSDAQ